MITRFDKEITFVTNCLTGIDLFLGAGFSVEARNRARVNLPTGNALLKLLKDKFPRIQDYPDLAKACTILERTCKEEFYDYLSQIFQVAEFNPIYMSLLKLSIKNIFTTNIDNLISEIFKDSGSSILKFAIS
jgi:hypothetical protein